MPRFNKATPSIILVNLLRLMLVILLVSYIGMPSAATVRINFAGTVTDGEGDTSVHNGTAIDGYFDYTTTALDENVSPLIGDYKQPITAIRIFLNGQEVLISGVMFDKHNKIFIEKRADFDYLLIKTNFHSETSFDGWHPLSLQITMSDSRRTAITDDSLPLSFSLDEFDGLGHCPVCGGEGYLIFIQGIYGTVGVVITYDYVVAELLQDDDPPKSKVKFGSSFGILASLMLFIELLRRRNRAL